MEEVFELADRVSVLRDGTLVGTRAVAETNEAELIALMINRSIEQIYHKETIPLGATILRDATACPGTGFEDVSLTRAGGRDRRPLRPDRRRPQRVRAWASTAASRKTAGEILWQGKPVDIRNEARRDRARHRAGARKPARPGALPQSRRRPQPQPADLSTA